MMYIDFSAGNNDYKLRLNTGFDIIIPKDVGLNLYNYLDNVYFKEDLTLDFTKPEKYKNNIFEE